jgi:acyl-CoA synthetase (AMP-forming)/AMP-acid ligase II
VSGLPRTPAGKVNRKALREAELAAPSDAGQETTHAT